MKKPVLYIFSGLPGVGKSTLAKGLAKHLIAAYIRIDSLEQALRDDCGLETIDSRGYELAYRLATDVLTAGCNVVADSVNPLTVTRISWIEVAAASGANFMNIEITCSDRREHQYRVENRAIELPNLKLPTWDQVLSRPYENWQLPRIQIDTAGKRIEDSLSELISSLQPYSGS